MKRKLLALLLSALLLCFSCTAYAEADDATAEGYAETGEGYTSVVTWMKNGELNIFGKLYYPEDFDESRKYPVIIMCHGTDATHEIYEKGQWPMKMARAGYISYVFDFCGGSAKSLSDLTVMELSGETMQSDISAILDQVKALPYCDTDKVFIMGQSRGGMMAAMAAGRRPDEYAGLILLYPGLGLVDKMREAYPDPDAIPDVVEYNGKADYGRVYAADVYDWDVPGTLSQFKGNVIIIHGMADKTVDYSVSVNALENYYAESESELVLVSGKQSVHAFDAFWAPGQTIAWNAVLDYMETEVAREVSAD